MVAGMVRPPDRGPPIEEGAVKGRLLAGDPSFDESSSSSSSSESDSAATALPTKADIRSRHNVSHTCSSQVVHFLIPHRSARYMGGIPAC